MRISDWSSDVCSSDLLEHRKVDVIGHRNHAVEERKVPVVTLDADGELQLFRHECAPWVVRFRGDRCRKAPVSAVVRTDDAHPFLVDELGRAACRERVCEYV